MSKKKVGIWMDEGVARRLDELSERYDGLKGDIVSAAVDMFLRSDQATQRKALEDVMKQKLNKVFGEPDLKYTEEFPERVAAKLSKENKGSKGRKPS